MSDKINIVDILIKHYPRIPAELDQKRLKAAIREIVEAVVDKCEKDARAVLYRSENDERLDDAVVDEQSIQQVKQMIDYE